MSKTAFFHIGILVADLEQAIARFDEALGMTFTDPTAMDVTLHDPDPVESCVRAAFSTSEGPLFELIEAQGDGVLSLDNGEGLHHVSFWADDYDRFTASPTGLTLPAGPRFCLAGGAPTMWLSNPADLHGVRVEFTDSALRPMLEAGLAAGRVE